ncbi:MAG TPA: 6-carboxytetrahydropterin synthase QueD [Candidatus Acidoferrales bacterium]|nr:6-carboxytetrahydropterin synthase QueD [Candidatus Acidoferrales bacterium]
MRVELTKTFRFEAAHHLPQAPPDHKCRRVHGHSYAIDVVAAGEVDPATGWLVDFGEIAAQVEPLLRRELDHRLLNDVAGLENPTAEVLCGWLWRRIQPLVPQLASITVHETCTARCTYRGQ